MVIGFEGTDPVKVADVVNRYVSIALESSIEDRRDQSDSTLSFFQQEVQRLSQELDLQSGKIVTFKDENGDALPENLEYRQNRESLLQERVSRGERELERFCGSMRPPALCKVTQMPDSAPKNNAYKP